MEDILQQQDMSQNLKPIKIKTWKTTNFTINTKLISPILKEIHEKESQRNLFGYLTELSARRGIFSATKEGIENDEGYYAFVRKTLDWQFFPFMQIINLARNILSHHMNSNLAIKSDDYAKQKTFLLQKDITRIHLKFSYATYIKEWRGSKDYWIDIKINIKNLREWMSIYKIISHHQLYLLSELCYNLSEIYRVKHLSEKQKKE